MSTKATATFGVTEASATLAHQSAENNPGNPAQAFADALSAAAILAIYLGIDEDAIHDHLTEAYHSAEVSSVENKGQWGL